ncbi:hypothetical protein [Allocoleopsis sp.]|uniref:hypothetical protein n=1 Tax=Allocoleopsis sp. TaxID=3088169 RepID=UPI002FD6221B
MLRQPLSKNSSPSTLNAASLQELVAELDEGNEESLSGGLVVALVLFQSPLPKNPDASTSRATIFLRKVEAIIRPFK